MALYEQCCITHGYGQVFLTPSQVVQTIYKIHLHNLSNLTGKPQLFIKEIGKSIKSSS